MAQAKSLVDFLVEAELEHYQENFKKDLKVHSVSHIKYVEDKDLQEIGMTKPEIRRLRKFYKKECPQGALQKLKKILVMPGAGSQQQSSGDGSESTGYLTPTPPVTDLSRSPLVPRSPGKHIIPEGRIQLVKTLGTGEFGTVEEGIWTNENGQKIQVAIKCLSRDKMESGVGDFMKEAAIMHSLQHDHLVLLYGVVLAPDRLMLVSELAPDRSLLECLRTSPANFSVLKLCNLSIQVCDAMAYLERRRLIHRDLAARNLLLFTPECVKIADFGLSRALSDEKDFYQTEYKPSLRLPLAWCAPECINFLRFTSASDVWAFGVTMWEMFSFGDQPWAGLTGQEILDTIDEPSCQRLPQPERCPIDVYKQMLSCWEHEPDDRPKFSELLKLLPSLKPEQVQAREDSCGDPEEGYLLFKQGDVITVLDKSPDDPPVHGLWRGGLNAGQTGHFDPGHTMVYMEVKAIPGPTLKSKTLPSSTTSQSTLSLKEKFSRKAPARRHSNRQKLDVSMISEPKGELRHTAHIGYDGAVFGDVSFMGTNTDKIPLKLPLRGIASGKAPVGSVGSLSKSDTDSEGTAFKSSSSDTHIPVGRPGPGRSNIMSQSMYPTTSNGHSGAGDKYEDVEDSLDSFKLPDLSSGLDAGPSLFDEIFSSLSVNKDFELNSTSPELPRSDDRSPLIRKDASLVNGNSFDNVALVPNDREKESQRESTPETDSSESSVHSPNSSPPVTSLPTEESLHKTGWRPKLKVQQDDLEDEDTELIKGKPRQGIRTLSESEEKEFNEAVELANEFAQRSNSATPSPKPAQSPSEAGRYKVFNFLTSKKDSSRESTKVKDTPRSFTEEIQRIQSTEPEMSEQAQEVYDALVTKGGVGERSLKATPRDLPLTSTHAANRMKRSHEQQNLDSSGGSSGGASVSSYRPQIRSANLNIREPQGIPSRKASGSDDVSNPLRRLRDGSALVVNPVRSVRKPPAIPPSAAPVSPNSVKLATPEKSSPETLDSGDELGSEGSNPVPLPPRSSRSGSTSQSTRHVRKYPLNLGESGHNVPSLPTNHEAAKHGDSVSTNRSISLTAAAEGNEEAPVFTDNDIPSMSAPPPPLPRRGASGSSLLSGIQGFSVKSVKLSARDLGYRDLSDQFWTQRLSLETLRDPSPAPPLIPGRESEQDICDEVRLMRRVLSKDVTIEDCMYSLEETEWDVNSAIKLVKLKQLLSLNLADMEHCKSVLLRHQWNVEAAVNHLLQESPGQSSPELVHV